MRTGIGGLDLGIAGAPPAPEMGARLPVPGVDLSFSGPPLRWRCWMCGGDGGGDLPREHSSGLCLGVWWRAVRSAGDWLTRAGIWLRTAAIWHAHRKTAWRKAMHKEPTR